MQRIKKPLVWLMLVSLVISLFPVGGARVAEAASTTFFTPTDLAFKDTVGLKLSGTTDLLSRSNAYKVLNSNLEISGSYSKMTEKFTVTVEQLVWDSVNKTWKLDPTRFSSSPLSVDTSNNRFTAKTTLYPGFNKVTLSGYQNNQQHSESFYALYDQIPYIESLQVNSGSGWLNLNEGSNVVVTNKSIYLKGYIQNVTSMNVSVGNGEARSVTSFRSDGYFDSPPLQLESGLNTLNLVITNNSDTIKIQRQLYYYNENEPFTKLEVVNGGTTHNLWKNKPTLTGDGTANPINAQLLIPASALTGVFNKSGLIVKINNTPVAVSATDITAIEVPGLDGVSTAYWLVDFKVPHTFSVPGDNPVEIEVQYGTFLANYKASLKFLEGQTVIKQIYYLPDYVEADGNNGFDNTKTTQVPLNGASLKQNSFYILVDTSALPTPPEKLTAKYLPLGEALVISNVVATSGNKQIYQVTNFANGIHQVRFQYPSSEGYYNANISYSSKNYINIDNYFDGQSIEVDSRYSGTLDLEFRGEYIGFENMGGTDGSDVKPQWFINGVLQNADTDKYTKLTIDTVTNNATFTVAAKVGKDLFFGENRIRFIGKSVDASANFSREVIKEIRIYIVDKNTSNISNFQPANADPIRRPAFPPLSNDADLKEADMNALASSFFTFNSNFTPKDGLYETSQDSYDLVLRGNGASIINLYLGSQLFFASNAAQIDLTGDKVKVLSGNFDYKNIPYTYEIVGNEYDFILRIKDLKFEAPASHVYNLELINGTGSRTTQRLEVKKVLLPYRIIAPQPTVGERYIVNKNFVHFDIEAIGATKVLIGKEEALPDDKNKNRFVLDYVGLKPDKDNSIKIQIVRANSTDNATISVYYTSTVTIDSQYMAEKVSTKYSVFNKEIELSFPKGTILKSATPIKNITKFYPNTKLLFGIADPSDGVVGRRDDYANIINAPKTNPDGGKDIAIPYEYKISYNNTENTSDFTTVSDVYWISGGMGENGDVGDDGYLSATNGLAPYSEQGTFGDPSLFDRSVVPTQRGSLKLQYNSNVVDEAGTLITVFRYTSGKVWENIGGEVDTKNNTITVPFDKFGYYKVMKLSRGYSDITNHPWARNILNALYSKGIMPVIRSDRFGADDLTTRGEFTMILVKGLNLPLNYDNNKPTFLDVDPLAKTSTWSYEYIETAARAGIVTGVTEGFFRPNQEITREQAAVMIARALELKTAANDTKLESTLAKSFMDSTDINKYARPAVDAVNRAKIMSGSPVTTPGQKKQSFMFNAGGYLTRAEAGKIAVELLKKSTKIFPKNLS